MSAPIALPAELGVYLGDDAIDLARAELILAQAQLLCETIVSPIPDTAAPIVLGVAARAYNNVTSAHQLSLGTAHVTYGTQNTSMGVGGMYLSKFDTRTLRRLAGRSGAFSIDMLPDPWPPV